MFAPKITEIACGSVISPALVKPMTITVVAELLCKIAVTSAPASAPITGFLVRKASTFFIFAPAAFCSASLIEFMPNRKRARPPASPNTVLTVSFISYLAFTQFLLYWRSDSAIYPVSVKIVKSV